MNSIEQIKEFEGQKVRTVWIEEEQEWYFSIVDVCHILTDQPDLEHARNYWKVLKSRLKVQGNETVTNCNRFKLVSQDGKRRFTDVATTEQLFRIIQAIPSRKAEPFKLWMARIAAERIAQIQDPERSIDQAIADFRRLGYSEEWINKRIKTIEIRKALTDEWKRGGVTQEVDFALLTDLMSKTWSGLTTREYKKHKGLKKESLRDNMTNMELLLNALAEESATQLSKERNPEGLKENADVAREGAEVAKGAREDIEKRIGHSVISSECAIDHVTAADELPFEKRRELTEGDKEESF